MADDWTSVIPTFRAKAAEFMNIVARVEASQPLTTVQQMTKKTLLASAAAIKATIETITKAIDAVSGFMGVGSLGLVPLIPLAFVLAAIASITGFVALAIKYLNEVDAGRVEIAKTAQANGATPQQVQAMLMPDVTSFSDKLKANWVPWTVAAGIIFIILRVKAKSPTT